MPKIALKCTMQEEINSSSCLYLEEQINSLEKVLDIEMPTLIVDSQWYSLSYCLKQAVKISGVSVAPIWCDEEWKFDTIAFLSFYEKHSFFVEKIFGLIMGLKNKKKILRILSRPEPEKVFLLENLSSGIKKILFILYVGLQDDKKTIIINGLEDHLHPSNAQLVSRAISLGLFGDKVIATTNSPFVIQSWHSKVIKADDL